MKVIAIEPMKHYGYKYFTFDNTLESNSAAGLGILNHRECFPRLGIQNESLSHACFQVSRIEVSENKLACNNSPATGTSH
jgi:hypothetical protein